MIKNSFLTRQQKLDACAICHSGNDKIKVESRFKFSMGDTLAGFFMQHGQRSNTVEFDVHGNQYNMLSQSRCFLAGSEMTCGTCHDPHKNAAGNIKLYSQKCTGCHNGSDDFCPVATASGEGINANCIDCHMPKQPSRAITFQFAGSTKLNSYLLRTHRIAIYRDSILKKKHASLEVEK